jgi:hypothetical protein
MTRVKPGTRFGRRPFGLRYLLVACLFVGSAWPSIPFPRQEHPPPPVPSGPPPPPRMDARGISERIERVRRDLAESNALDSDSAKLLLVARGTLNHAEHALRENDLSRAERLQAAADAFWRATEHPLHLTQPPKLPHPPVQAREIADHLQRVYFRLQQADFFATLSGDEDAKVLPGIARKFYERSREAYDRSAWFEADECAKSADDTLHGLENLAQAVPESAPPQRPR